MAQYKSMMGLILSMGLRCRLLALIDFVTLKEVQRIEPKLTTDFFVADGADISTTDGWRLFFFTTAGVGDGATSAPNGSTFAVNTVFGTVFAILTRLGVPFAVLLFLLRTGNSPQAHARDTEAHVAGDSPRRFVEGQNNEDRSWKANVSFESSHPGVQAFPNLVHGSCINYRRYFYVNGDTIKAPQVPNATENVAACECSISILTVVTLRVVPGPTIQDTVSHILTPLKVHSVIRSSNSLVWSPGLTYKIYSGCTFQRH